MSNVNELFQEFERGSDAIKEKLAKSFYELGKEAGIKKERERLLAWLRENRVIRDSILGNGLVIYTEDGPIDLNQLELEGEK